MAAVVRHVGLAPHPAGELRTQNIAEPIGLAKICSHIGAAFYNMAVSGVPFHAARQAYSRPCGMKIGKKECSWPDAKRRGFMISRWHRGPTWGKIREESYDARHQAGDTRDGADYRRPPLVVTIKRGDATR